MFDVIFPVTQDMATQLIATVVNILVAVGVVKHPTTQELVTVSSI